MDRQTSGPARFRTHKALIATLRREVLKQGAYADVERFCPELYKRRSDGSWNEARLDLVIRYPGCLQSLMVDVAVYSPYAKSRDRCAVVPGFAARAGENAKLARYGECVRPLVFESFGRLGAKSMDTLYELAAWTVASSTSPGMMPCQSALVRRWRTALETRLLFEKADLLVQSLGGHAAGWSCGAQ